MFNLDATRKKFEKYFDIGTIIVLTIPSDYITIWNTQHIDELVNRMGVTIKVIYIGKYGFTGEDCLTREQYSISYKKFFENFKNY